MTKPIPGGIAYRLTDNDVLIATLDMPSQTVNTMNTLFDDILDHIVATLQSGAAQYKGLIITSGKPTFFAGGDLRRLLAFGPDDGLEAFIMVEAIKERLRQIEKQGVPVVACINGSALGGGLELALACHRRIALDNPKTEIGLPEVTLGLLPGAGGLVRLTRMLGLEKALGLLMEGRKLKVQEALDLGLVDEIAPTVEAMLAQAEAWILSGPSIVKPWDIKGYKMPGGDASTPKNRQLLTMAPAMLVKKTRGLLPAPGTILAATVEGSQVDFDTACRIESRKFAQLAVSPVAKNTISTFFFGMNAIQAGASRPQDIAARRFAKVGVLGAGMMGAGITYVAARAGLQVVLKDVTLDKAGSGKEYSRRLLDSQVAKGRLTDAQRDEILERIVTTAQAADLVGCDLVVEAVFEDAQLKAAVTREVLQVLGPDVVFATNTSTLPITRLAAASDTPANFVGLHFFSPVDKMQLVEIIRGEQTSDATVAAAFDFVRQIKKVPMVANDRLGFFTSRVFGSYIDEGLELLREGVQPELIDNVARLAGMPVGPLTVLDEVSLKLLADVRDANLKMLDAPGAGWVLKREASGEVLDFAYRQSGRLGKAYNGGLYDYVDGVRKVWPALRERFPAGSTAVPNVDVAERLLFRQVLEAFQCLDDDVLASELDGNIGSLLGIGFPTHTGGVFQYVDTYGVERFIERSRALADRYGARFDPPPALLVRAAAGSIV